MSLSHKARKRWSLMILLVGLPAYLVVAVTLVGLLERPSFWGEAAIYVLLGFLWMIPLRRVFMGVGQPDPDISSSGRADADEPCQSDGGAPAERVTR